MNKLIITEKPSVGATYAALLGAKKRMDGGAGRDREL